MDTLDLILDKINAVDKKIDKVEKHVEKHYKMIHELHVETVEDMAACKTDCTSKITAIRFTLLKLLAVAAAGGIAGSGLTEIIGTF